MSLEAKDFLTNPEGEKEVNSTGMKANTASLIWSLLYRI